MKQLAIGQSDFKTIIKHNKYYIDKTLFIKDVIDSQSDFSLITRPRRFGKTLNLGMLDYFFNVEEQNKELFENLDISKEKDILDKYLNQYPVIFITFKEIKNQNFEGCLSSISALLSGMVSKYEKEIYSVLKRLDKNEKNSLINILEDKAIDENYQVCLKSLSKVLYLYYDKEVVLLIDEYDTPIHSSYIGNYYQELMEFMKSFLSNGLKDNKYLFRGVITGILRIAKESIFSGLNNVISYTILDNYYSNRFGFTIDETRQILIDAEIENNFDEVLENYNGYKIGDLEILNPWSLLCYVGDEKHRLLAYWANTASNELIQELIKISSDEFKTNLEVLLKNKVLQKIKIDSNIVFSMLDNDTYIYSLLFFSGYLKCINQQIIDSKYYCDLQVVNMETLSIFKDTISNWINSSFQTGKLKILLKSLVDGDIKLFEKLFSRYILETLSYFDVNRSNEEAVYQAFLLGILINLEEYEVISNQEAGYGRFDILILHKTDKKKLAIIMELKTIDEFEEETKEIALEKALTQIEEKKYETATKKRGYENILKLGVVFDGKRCWIKR